MIRYRASFLTYIVGNYEKVQEVAVKTPDCQYVLVTDNKELKSNTWDIKYVDNPYPDDPFWLCYEIRFNPFKYVDSDVVVRIDGSMRCVGDFTYVLDYFEKGGYDRLLCSHPTRNNIYDERVAWVQTRNFNIKQAERVLTYMQNFEGYNVKEFKGLFQMNIEIVRNNKINNLANSMTLNLLEYLAPEGKQVERIDQDVFTFIIQKYFDNIKILLSDQQIAMSGKYFLWMTHNTDIPMVDQVEQRCEPYLFGKGVTTMYLGY